MTDPNTAPSCPQVPEDLFHWIAANGPTSWREDVQYGAQWGFEEGIKVGQQRAGNSWPTPIIDRPPTKADADKFGNVYVQDDIDGYFHLWFWSTVAEKGWPWCHTPQWRPPAPSARDAVIKALRERMGDGDGTPASDEDTRIMRLALRALEGCDG